MHETRILMGMPITVEIVDAAAPADIVDRVFEYFEYVDAKFSPFKDDSELTRINDHRTTIDASSEDMRTIFALAEQTKRQTSGYFDIARNGTYDPSGIVKGWAIHNAADIVRRSECANYYIDAGGDVQAAGKNRDGQSWRVGIRNPFNLHEIVKVLSITDRGVATSGTTIRGQHIYNPHDIDRPLDEIVSLTVIGPNVYEADRFATAAFAMGRAGILFIEGLSGFEGYMIDADRHATFTSGFGRYVSDG
ncbi:MAG: FAD:protein FMN transferase [Ardenticatenales bacterium]